MYQVEKKCVNVYLSYQAHLGLDTVQVYTGDHLQGDGVLTRLHVVHLDNKEKQQSSLLFINTSTERTSYIKINNLNFSQPHGFHQYCRLSLFSE